MKMCTVGVDHQTQTGARMLDRAEGILVGVRRCSVDAAFEEIVSASKRHCVPTLTIAGALVGLAEGATSADECLAAVAARDEWGSLFK